MVTNIQMSSQAVKLRALMMKRICFVNLDGSLPCSEVPFECVEELLWSEVDPFNYGNDNDIEDPGEVLQSE